MSVKHRNSTRLREFDYTTNGAYFITICAFKREHIFGEILEGQMQHNAIGQIVLEEWEQTQKLRAEVTLDTFVVMPNHVHGVVWIERDPVGAQRAAPLRPDDARFRTTHRELAVSKNNPPKQNEPEVRPGSLGAIVRAFKSAVTKRINESRVTPGLPVWQRNYHDRVIRNDRELSAIREYITFNPQNWSRDLKAKSDLELANVSFLNLEVVA
jgi:putative transposase